MKLIIKNMVCHRCILAVTAEARKLGLHPVSVNLGELMIAEEQISDTELARFDKALQELGFERIDDSRSRIIEKIKNVVVDRVHQHEEGIRTTWSDLISSELHYDYNYLSNLFSSVEGITLEQYIIRQKIEKVKELLLYDELSLGEIAWKMGYNSAAYLSNQFKKVTGFTPGQFKKLIDKGRTPLDKL